MTTIPEGKNFRNYLGPRGKPEKYLSHIQEPHRMKFRMDIVVNGHEIRVVKHIDLIFIKGADVLYRISMGQNTCYNSIWVLQVGYVEVEFGIWSPTQTNVLGWATLPRGHHMYVKSYGRLRFQGSEWCVTRFKMQ